MAPTEYHKGLKTEVIVQIRKPTMFRNALDLGQKSGAGFTQATEGLSPELGGIVRKTGNSVAGLEGSYNKIFDVEMLHY